MLLLLLLLLLLIPSCLVMAGETCPPAQSPRV
jgi:hypothetical protein